MLRITDGRMQVSHGHAGDYIAVEPVYPLLEKGKNSEFMQFVRFLQERVRGRSYKRHYHTDTFCAEGCLRLLHEENMPNKVHRIVWTGDHLFFSQLVMQFRRIK